MNIQANEEKGVLTLIPSNEEEGAFLNAVKTTRQPGGTIKYNGRSGAEVRSPYSERMILGFLLDKEELKIQASDDGSEKVLRQMRDAVYLASGVLILVDHAEVDGKVAVNFCVRFCKVCNNPIIKRSRASWKMCDACSEKCSHEWTSGMTLNKGLPGFGEYCSKCGTGKPLAEGQREKTKIEQELEIQNKLGIMIAYTNGPPHSPKQAIEMNRVIKRYRRAKARQ